MSVYDRLEKLEEHMDRVEDIIYHFENLIKLFNLESEKDFREFCEEAKLKYEQFLKEDEEEYFRLKKRIGRLL